MGQKVIGEKFQRKIQLYFTRREELEQIKQNVFCLLNLGGGCIGLRCTILCSYLLFLKRWGLKKEIGN